jgi:hypothetical protein
MAAAKKATTKQAPSSTGTEAVIKETEAPVVVPEPVETPPVVEEKKKIEVDADTLAGIISELNELKTNQKQFEDTASQDQIARIERLRASGKLVKAVKLRRVDGKLVLAWKTEIDEVYYADGKIHERQEYKVHFEDGSSKVMPLIQLTRATSYESFEVIKEAKLADGRIEYTLQKPDGEELVVNETYVN